MEQLVNQGEANHGFVIMLTNDPRYWSDGNPNAIDAQFQIHEGVAIHGQRNWSNNPGTWVESHPSLNLQGEYTMHWHDYSHPRLDAKFGHLRVLIARIPA